MWEGGIPTEKFRIIFQPLGYVYFNFNEYSEITIMNLYSLTEQSLIASNVMICRSGQSSEAPLWANNQPSTSIFRNTKKSPLSGPPFFPCSQYPLQLQNI